MILIAQVYPCIYIFKLFLKKVGGYDQASLQCGMQGNISSYKLNMNSVALMLEGNLMLQFPEILASSITITFIGAGDLLKRSLWTTFHVQRHIIAEALQWLREILNIVHQSNDVGVVD
jgi:hypothetical protein